MKFYLIDDDRNVLNLLKRIIRDRGLGEICGTALNGQDALEDIATLRPDIIIVDLLMPEMDGITFVKKARTLLPDTACIMLSQVVSKDMIGNAYECGVEFYIQKPVNSIEVESVIKRVSQSLTAKRTLEKVQNIFMEQKPVSSPLSPPEPTEKPHVIRLRGILQKLGIIGEKGSKDIITLVDYLIEHGEKMQDATLEELCRRFSDSPKTMEQRIRRTAISGMVNLANLGLEDYSNDIFVTYANSLYNFEQVRREMDYIRGKSEKHGNVKIKNFLNSLMLACMDS
ncbi:response regulator [Roseburia hominis]